MAVANEIPVDAARRRRRRVAWVLAFAAALLGAAFVADSLLNGRGEETAWTADTVFPKLTQQGLFKPRGVTVSIGKRVIHAGQGGPEDPGPYIEEAADGWLLADGQTPIDGLARSGFTLPGHMPVPGSGFGGGGFGGGSSGGGGDGGIVLSCEQNAAAMERLTGKKCPENGSGAVPTETTDDGGLTILPVVASPIPSSFGPTVPTLDTGGPDGTPPGENGPGVKPVAPVSVVPEPQNWAMMIAGFFMAGMATRRRRARQTRQTVP